MRTSAFASARPKVGGLNSLPAGPWLGVSERRSDLDFGEGILARSVCTREHAVVPFPEEAAQAGPWVFGLNQSEEKML